MFLSQASEEDLVVDNRDSANDAHSENFQQELGLGVGVHSLHISPEGELAALAAAPGSSRRWACGWLHRAFNHCVIKSLNRQNSDSSALMSQNMLIVMWKHGL